jgi:hypothetical protein
MPVDDVEDRAAEHRAVEDVESRVA